MPRHCQPKPPLPLTCPAVHQPRPAAAVPVASCSLNLDWDDDTSNPIEGEGCC